MPTNLTTITSDQCLLLADEAAVAGDERMYRIALRAAEYLEMGWADASDESARDESAVRTCLRVIREAEADTTTSDHSE